MTPPPCLGSELRLPFLLPSCSQSLLELHKRRKALTEPEARYYLRQIVLGCQYLHGNRVIHRDLKLGNLFLNEDLEVKIGKELGLQGHLTCSGDEEELGGRVGERKFGKRQGREKEDGRKSGLLIASRILSLGRELEPQTNVLSADALWGVCSSIQFFVFLRIWICFHFLKIFFNLLIFGCTGSPLLRAFLWLRGVGAALRCSVRVSHCSGFSCCEAQASAVVAPGLCGCGRFSSCGTWA